MSLLEFFQWLQFSPLLVEMRSSPWIFPIIASVHLLGLALLGGAVLVVDLRLLGFGLLTGFWVKMASLFVMLACGTADGDGQGDTGSMGSSCVPGDTCDGDTGDTGSKRCGRSSFSNFRRHCV